MEPIKPLIIRYPDRKLWKDALCRPSYVTDRKIVDTVSAILHDIESEGLEKVCEYTRKLDGWDADPVRLKVSEEEFLNAEKNLGTELPAAIDTAYENIRKFHEAQLQNDITVETMPGVLCMQKNIPIPRIGLYIPGGTAPLFSTVLMLAVPAGIAGCRDVVLCTPADRSGRVSPEILYCARKCGIENVYKLGGAVAIGTMAYGAGAISKVDKIFGPGNAYVTEAKQQVAATVCSIDMPAGPSEIMIMADDTAVPQYVCADFLSQLEHGPGSQAILVTCSETLAAQVESMLGRQAENLGRKEFLKSSASNSRVVLLKTEEEMADMVNMYAPEHLVISMAEPWKTVGKIYNAGSVFLGNYSPESAGDYASGTNHTLPTGGWAKSCSGVNISSYMKKMTIQELTEEGLRSLGPTIMAMASAEGLEAHGKAVEVRVENKSRKL